MDISRFLLNRLLSPLYFFLRIVYLFLLFSCDFSRENTVEWESIINRHIEIISSHFDDINIDNLSITEAVYLYDKVSEELSNIDYTIEINEINSKNITKMNKYFESKISNELKHKLEVINNKLELSENYFSTDDSEEVVCQKCTYCIGLHKRCCANDKGNGFCVGVWTCQQCVESQSCGCY